MVAISQKAFIDVNGRTIFLTGATLLTVAVSLAAWLEPRSETWRGGRARAEGLLATLLGDGRRLFANHFFVKADVYLHSGYYPSIFDQARQACDHGIGSNPEHTESEIAADTGSCKSGCEHHDHEASHESGFLGPPRDWIDRLGRHFRVTQHTHLEDGVSESEILPWLRVAMELDPHQVEVYTTAAYWLGRRLGKVNQAEAVLRRGLRSNPDSEEILLELGRLAWEHRRDAERARHLWNAAERVWQRKYLSVNATNRVTLARMLALRAQMEETLGHTEEAIRYWSRLQEVSPHPEAVARRVAALRSHLPQTPWPADAKSIGQGPGPSLPSL
ncbi:MAG: hypothetical protein RMN51_13425 [Verrucomicrobiota bacterium]|nr:hypothetical protein [Limisphaera sp.]MDW8383094.1 hypothetical protein [Verrucomicrobiota bacterium]